MCINGYTECEPEVDARSGFCLSDEAFRHMPGKPLETVDWNSGPSVGIYLSGMSTLRSSTSFCAFAVHRTFGETHIPLRLARNTPITDCFAHYRSCVCIPRVSDFCPRTSSPTTLRWQQIVIIPRDGIKEPRRITASRYCYELYTTDIVSNRSDEWVYSDYIEQMLEGLCIIH